MVTTFTYDANGRLASEKRLNGPAGTDYHYTYTYGAGGNIATRKNENGGAMRNYVYDIDDTPNDGRHYHALESVTGDGLTASFINDPNGNMSSRTMGGVTYTQAFDVENRLASVTVNGQTTAFYYDAGGNRALTVQPDGTKVYTPFPEYEKTVPVTGSSTERNHYTLAGQLVAVRVKVAGQTGAFYYFYTDRQGSVHALRKADGTWVNGNYARYDAYGGYRTKPATTVNPGISDRGYTGHRMNNTGNDLGLIYMNARYYLPEVGRFISADTIVPDPKDPQSYNRYAYSNNNPINYVDPSGHDAVCSVADSNGNYSGDCNDWMTQAMVILGLEGGPDGVRLAALFWQWFNDPGKMLRINAFYVSGSSMFTRQLSADTATIGIDMNVVLDFKPNEIALLGHELEHVSQGTWQAWSIQGEVLAYQVEFRIREAMGIGQTSNTDGAMGRLGEINRKPYDAQSYKDLIEARFGFLGGEGEPYNVWFEPNLPWGQQILINSLAANKDVFVVDYSPWLTTLVDR